MNAGCWFVNVVNKNVYMVYIIINFNIVSFAYLFDLHCWSSDLKNFTVPYNYICDTMYVTNKLI